VIDFDKVIADLRKPGHSLAKYDMGDHLHPNPAGYAAMGSAIDLKTLTTQ
jgi:lysophospholipase L1-like esterase